MAISEHDRYELHKWFVDHAGEQVAETLMAHLPPVGWADNATRRDLDHVESKLGSAIESSADRLRAEFHDSLRKHTLTIVALNLSTFGAVVAVLR